MTDEAHAGVLSIRHSRTGRHATVGDGLDVPFTPGRAVQRENSRWKAMAAA